MSYIAKNSLCENLDNKVTPTLYWITVPTIQYLYQGFKNIIFSTKNTVLFPFKSSQTKYQVMNKFTHQKEIAAFTSLKDFTLISAKNNQNQMMSSTENEKKTSTN